MDVRSFHRDHRLSFQSLSRLERRTIGDVRLGITSYPKRTDRCHRVCITAIWPSFNTLPNHLPSGMHTTTSEFVGFIVFWVLTLPLLWIPPEKFRRPFQFITIYTGISLLSVREFYLQRLCYVRSHITVPGSGLVIIQGEGRRSRFSHRTKHRPIPPVNLMVNRGRHQFIHWKSSCGDGKRLRFLALRQE